MKSIAHLNGLRAFEASARHLSFSMAAKELNVTPAAIGQQVRLLEEWLDIKLFNRSVAGSSRLTLTKQAIKALPEITRGFEHLSSGLSLLQKPASNHLLTVTVSPAFAAKWLLMRIDSFQLQHPEFDLRLDTNTRTVDYFSEGIDIGVRYGKGNWAGLSTALLMTEKVFPVCSPDLIQQELKKPKDIKHFPLLHDQSLPEDSGFPTWQGWLESHNIVGVNTERGLRINNSASVIQAAVSGQGIALGRSVLVKDDLDCGRLIRPFADSQSPVELAYYVVWKPEHDNTEKVQAFRLWLQHQAKEIT